MHKVLERLEQIKQSSINIPTEYYDTDSDIDYDDYDDIELEEVE